MEWKKQLIINMGVVADDSQQTIGKTKVGNNHQNITNMPQTRKKDVLKNTIGWAKVWE